MSADIRRVGAVAADIVADIRFRRLVEQVHAHGPRVMAELLAEIAAERMLATYVEGKLERYAALPREAVEAFNAGRLPLIPLRSVQEDDGAD